MEKIALAQINIALGKFETNVATALDLIMSAGKSGCCLIMLPELWSSGFDYPNIKDYAAKNLSLLSHLQELANEYDLSIGGTLVLESNEGFHNSFHLVQPHLPVVFYHKNHLFGLMKEDRYFIAGNESNVFHSRLGLTGAAICFDLRFPDHFSHLTGSGAEVFLLPAHWPYRRVNHWDVLLQARAIENQAYLIAVNSTGITGNDTYAGHSAVIAPDGAIVMQVPNGQEGLFTVSIDPGLVSNTRNAFPLRKKMAS